MLIKEKAQIIHDKQNDDIISFYNNSLSPFIKELITSNPSYTNISSLSSEIEKLFNVAAVTTIFKETDEVNENQSSRVTMSFKTIKNVKGYKEGEVIDEINNSSFMNESIVSSAEQTKNPNTPEKISDYCNIQIKVTSNPLVSPEFEEEKEIEGENIITKCYREKDTKDICLISIDLFLKKIILEDDFISLHKDLLYGFLQQYQAFISLEILIKKIINAYEYYSSKKKMNNLVKFINMIIIQLYEHIEENQDIKSLLRDFYTKLPITPITQSILYLLSSDCEQFDFEYIDYLSNPLPHSSPNVFIRPSYQNKPSSANYFSIFDYDEETIASQLTYITRALISNIKEKEIISAKFAKKNKMTLSPNVLKVIKRFDDLIFFILEEIMSYDKSKVRALVIEKWIKVSLICKQMNNFNDCMIITTALMNFILKKMQKTWKKVRPEYIDILKKLKMFCTCEECYKNIRKAIENCVLNKMPFIPYLGILLKDISFYEEKYRYIEKDKLVNFEKIVKVSNAIAKFNQFHNFVYSCRPNKALNLFNHLSPLNERALEYLCSKLEPEFCMYEIKSNKKRVSRTDLHNYNLRPLPVGFLVTIKDDKFIIKENHYHI